MRSSLYPISVLAFISAACGRPEVAGEATANLQGSTSVGSPLTGARITVYGLGDSSADRRQIGSGTTDSDGTFVVQLEPFEGTALACATSGSYVELATATLVQVSGAEICAPIFELEHAQTREVHVSLWHVLVFALAQHFEADGMPFPTAYAEAKDEWERYLSCGTSTSAGLLGAQPIDPTVLGAPSQLTPGLLSGLLAGGFSYHGRLVSEYLGLTPGTRINSLTTAAAYIEDLGDGELDGLGSGSNPIDLNGYLLTPDSFRGEGLGFAQGVRHFVESDRNATAFTLDDVIDLVNCWAEYTEDFFSDGTDVNPIDVVGPEIQVLQPTDESILSADTPIWLIAADGSEVTRFEIIEGASQVADETPTYNGLSADLKGTLLVSTLDDGDGSFVVEAEDGVGNTSTLTVPFSVDKSAPAITIVTPAVDATVSGTVTVEITAEDEQGLTEFVLLQPDVGAVASGGSITTSWDTLVEPDGNYVIRIRASDTQNHEAVVERTVQIDNYGTGTLSGLISLETPVANAEIEVLEYADGLRGEVLAESSSGSDGRFTVTMPDTWDGPILVRAFGRDATYIDAATGDEIPFPTDAELVATIDYTRPLLPDTRLITGLTANAATTLAAELASVLAREVSFAQAANEAHRLFGRHLERTVQPNGVQIRWTPIADWLGEDPPTPTEERRLLALFHIGISRWGAEVSTRWNQSSASSWPTIRTLDFLKRDLSDGCLDGRDVNYQDIWLLDSPQRARLEVDTLRSHLASSTLRWLDNIVLPDGTSGNPNTTGVDSSSYAESGAYFDALSTDDSDLFCGTPGALFDTVPPDVELRFIDGDTSAPIDHTTTKLRDTVKLVVTATDVSGFALDPVSVSPPDPFAATHWIDSPPDSPIAAELGLDTVGFADGEHTVTVTAVDALGYAGSADITFTVDNTPPSLSVAVPAYSGSTSVSFGWTVSDTIGPIDRIEIWADNASNVSELKTIVPNPAGTGSTTIGLGHCDAQVDWTMIAYDDAGWSTPRTGVIICDQRPPMMSLVGNSYWQENTLTRTPNADGTVVYGSQGTPITLHDATSPTLNKYRSRFVDGGPNIPTLTLDVEDPQTEGFEFNPDQLTVQYRYSNNGGTNWHRGWTTISPTPGQGVFELQLLASTLHNTVLNISPDQLQRIEFRASDPAGNTQDAFYFDFYLDLLPDPLVVHSCGWTSTMAGATMAAHTLTGLFSSSGTVWRGGLAWDLGPLSTGVLAQVEYSAALNGSVDRDNTAPYVIVGSGTKIDQVSFATVPCWSRNLNSGCETGNPPSSASVSDIATTSVGRTVDIVAGGGSTRNGAYFDVAAGTAHDLEVSLSDTGIGGHPFNGGNQTTASYRTGPFSSGSWSRFYRFTSKTCEENEYHILICTYHYSTYEYWSATYSAIFGVQGVAVSAKDPWNLSRDVEVLTACPGSFTNTVN